MKVLFRESFDDQCLERLRAESPGAWAAVLMLSIEGKSPEQIAAKLPANAPAKARVIVEAAARAFNRGRLELLDGEEA